MSQHTSRAILGLLAAGLALVLIYLYLLTTTLFDSKAQAYPDLDVQSTLGPSLPIEEVLSTTPEYQKWLTAHEAFVAGDGMRKPSILSMLRDKGKRDEAAIAEWRSTAELARKAAAALVARPEAWRYDFPETSNPMGVGFSFLMPMRALIRDLHSLTLESGGNIHEVKDLAILQMRCARKMQDLDEILICRLVAMVNETLADQSLVRAMHACAAARDAAALAELAAVLEVSRVPGKVPMANALRGEFHFGNATTRELRGNLMTPSAYSSMLGMGTGGDAYGFFWIVLRTQPNRYAADAAVDFRHSIASLDLPAARRKPPAAPAASVWQMLNPAPNAGASALRKLGFGSFVKAIETSDLQEMRTAMLRTLLAIARYRTAYDGRLPATLDALVPEFLPAIPRDPFDGNPIRYDATRGLLWSIGTDLTDAAGLPPTGDDLIAPGIGIFWKDNTEPTIDLKVFFGE